MKYFFVTIKNNSFVFTSIADLESMYLSKFSEVSTLSFAIELDSVNRLHIHAIIQLDKTPKFTNFRHKGWSIHMCPLELSDLKRTDKYIHKNQKDNYIHEMEWISRADYNYMFI